MLETKYARDQSFSSRKKWQEVSIMSQGKITTREWQEFEVNFKYAWHQVRDATKEEARRLIIQKLPGFILRWVTEEEERRTADTPTVCMFVSAEKTSCGCGGGSEAEFENFPSQGC